MIQFLFRTDVQSLDFENGQKATDIINAWGASVTKNHIKNTISAGLYTREFMKFLTEIDFCSNVSNQGEKHIVKNFKKEMKLS